MTTRTLVALVLFCVAGVPLIIGVLLRQQADVVHVAEERDGMLAVTARDIASELHAEVERALDVARADGGMPALSALLDAESPDIARRLELNRYLNSIASRDPVNITSVALLDLAGRNRIDLAAAGRGSDESRQPYFAEVLRSGTAQLHGPHGVADQPGGALVIAAPVRDPANAMVGVLRIRLEPARVAQTVDKNLRLRPQLGAVVRDAAGQVFARAGQTLADGDPAATILDAPFDLAAGAAGSLGRGFAIGVPGTSWTLLVFEPAQQHAAAEAERRRQGLEFIALLCVLLALAAGLVGHLLARPLMQLTATADAIAAGDIDRRIVPGGTRELRQVGEAVNAMNARLRDNLVALREFADVLEQRVDARTAELESSHRQLSLAMEQLVQNEKLAALGSLVAGIAHELNTPIGNALTTATSLRGEMRRFRSEAEGGSLRRSSLNRLLDHGEEAGDIVERNLQRAAQLIGHFKQVAVDQSSDRRRRFDLRHTVDEVVTTLQPRLRRSSHRLSVEGAPGILMDSFPGALEQVVTNLVCNSLDHAFDGREGGQMQIQLVRAGERVHLLYRDDGRGIPRELHKRVFDPFFTTRLGSGGSGLGLYLVHSLVSGTLGGQLSLHSEVGQGVRFLLDLPLSAPAPAAGEAARAASPADER